MKKNLLVALFGAFGVLGNAQTFTNYTSSDGLLADNVNAVDTDANNTIWFGTQNGVSEYDGSTWVDHTNAIDAVMYAPSAIAEKTSIKCPTP